jgi:hypothetical protein
MNTNPKTYTVLKWSDFKVSKDLADYILSAFQLEPNSYINKVTLADALEMLKDAQKEDPEEYETMLKELTEVAKIFNSKTAYAILI